MENLPDHEYQRIHLLRAIRHAGIDSSDLWLHYFGLGGDAGEYEVEAYLHGSFTLPPLQRDLLAHAANELIDKLPPPPRAPYSTDPEGAGESEEPAVLLQEPVSGNDGVALTWLFDQQSGSEPDASDADSDGPAPQQPSDQ